MQCKSCKQCQYSKMLIRTVDEHLTVYTLNCTKYGVLGDTFAELLDNVKEERGRN